MQKVTLSALAALVVSGAAYADTMTLYTDPATGQVFTAPAEGRVEMGDFIDAKTVYLENQALGSLDELKMVGTENIETIYFLNASQATLRWGAGHGRGAILIILRG